MRITIATVWLVLSVITVMGQRTSGTLVLAPATQTETDEGRNAVEWKQLLNDKATIRGVTEPLTVYLAPATIKRNGETVKVWLRFVMPNGSAWAAPDTDYGEARFHAVFVCKDVGQARATAAVLYDRDGKYAASLVYDDDAGGEVPATVGRALYEYLCERGGPASTGPPVMKSRGGQ